MFENLSQIEQAAPLAPQHIGPLRPAHFRAAPSRLAVVRADLLARAARPLRIAASPRRNARSTSSAAPERYCSLRRPPRPTRPGSVLLEYRGGSSELAHRAARGTVRRRHRKDWDIT